MMFSFAWIHLAEVDVDLSLRLLSLLPDPALRRVDLQELCGDVWCKARAKQNAMRGSFRGSDNAQFELISCWPPAGLRWFTINIILSQDVSFSLFSPLSLDWMERVDTRAYDVRSDILLWNGFGSI